MPSLRQKVTTYFRQLSFIAEPRDAGRHLSSLSPRKNDNGNFITKYLEGRMENTFSPGPEIKHAQDPNNLPDLPIGYYPTGPNTITAAYTGPDEGLTGIKRSKLHLSAGSDIDFIDTNHEQETEIRRSNSNQKSKFNSQKYGRSDQNANKTSSTIKPRKNSRQEDNGIEKVDTKTTTATTTSINVIVSMVSTEVSAGNNVTRSDYVDGPDSKKFTKQIDISDCNKTNKENVFPNNDIACNQVTKDSSPLLENSTAQSLVSAHLAEPIAGVRNWNCENDHAYGIAVSLYEKNYLTNEAMGNPIADCFGLVVRGNCSAMALADGVNWGEGARLAARSAVHGSLEYLDTAIFGIAQGCMATSTNGVFVSLLRSFWEAHAFILEVGGALSTLTVAVVLPLSGQHAGKYVVCSCNVGDSLGYIYSKKHGVREFTQGSHDINSMRDMRDAQGALGPVDGNKPELSNLTLSMTIVEAGDIVFLTSDGISDNFDPVVGKFAEPFSDIKSIDPKLMPKRQNKSSSSLYGTRTTKDTKTMASSSNSVRTNNQQTYAPSCSTDAQPVRPIRAKKPQTAYPQKYPDTSQVPSRPKYMRSHTVIEPRISINKSATVHSKVPRSSAGLPLVTGSQRHELTLLRLEDLLSYGINGTLRPCPSAKKLCLLLVDFVKMITSARRKILEQRELFYKIVTGPDGIRREVELTRVQHRAARKRIVDGQMFTSLPGKLDHASVVAFTVGSGLQPTEFNETSF